MMSECLHCIQPFDLKQEAVKNCDGIKSYQLEYPNSDLDTSFQKLFLQDSNEPFYNDDNKVDTISKIFERAFELSQLIQFESDQFQVLYHPVYFFPTSILSETFIVNNDKKVQSGEDDMILGAVGPDVYEYYVTDFQEINQDDCWLS
eukprot:TRINITY_DN12138_c0_g2_i10.p3 TRINITY_DN12138_c0_g2~~TRINITY_DN12138_c0_g2_i10.p3  ORF type:complete len:147 (-),score=15.77 TRINITY_DN12138_c0_g2_i10:249-689(-)